MATTARFTVHAANTWQRQKYLHYKENLKETGLHKGLHHKGCDYIITQMIGLHYKQYCTLERSPFQGDMMKIFKIMKGIDKISEDSFSAERMVGKRTRGHPKPENEES